MRRVIEGDRANDVGYLYLRLVGPEGQVLEELQKFSWVFVRRDSRWQVLTDFDGTPAPTDLRDSIQAQYVIPCGIPRHQAKTRVSKSA